MNEASRGTAEGPLGGYPGTDGARRRDANPRTESREPAFQTAYVQHPSSMDEIDLLDLVKVVWRARWTIVAVTALSVLIAFGIVFTKERVYESKGVFVIQTRPLPVGPQQSGDTAFNTAVLINLLDSNQLAHTVVDSLALTDIWKTPDRNEAVKRLKKGLSLHSNDRDGIITISFQSTDPVLARDIVEAYVTQFEQRANDLNVTEADRIIEFAQERLDEVEPQLQQSIEKLLQFKERYGIASFHEQAEALVETHAELTNHLFMLNVELNGKRNSRPAEDPEVLALEASVAELRRQIRSIELGSRADETGAEETTHRFGFGLHEMAALALELEGLERAVRQHQQMYDLLRNQLESARLDVSRKMNIVRLIDPPEVPGEPLSRGLVLNVALAAVVGAFAALMFAFIAEFLRQRAQDDATVRELPFLRFFRGRGTSA